MFRPRCSFVLTCLLAVLATLAPMEDVFSQPGGGRGRGGGGFGGRGPGGRGGGGGTFGRGGGGSFGVLRDESVQSELGLSEDQINSVDELSGNLRPSREDMQPFFDRMQDAPDEEARTAIREEMQQAFQQRVQDAEQKLQGVLSDEQRKRLSELSLQRSGTRAFLQEEVLTSLKISEDQKLILETLTEQRNEAARELGFRASPEDLAAFREDWDAKFNEVLTDEQRKTWQAQLGKPFEFSNDGRGRGGPGGDRGRGDRRRDDGDSRQAQNDNEPAPRPQRPARVEAPVDPSQVVAGFGSADAKDEEGEDGSGDAKIFSFNFRQAPWLMVLEMFADDAKLTLNADVVPPGSFSHYDDASYTATEALDIINGYLLRKGYILVKRDRFLIVLNIDDGIPPNLVPTVSVDSLEERGFHELVNVVIPLEGVDTAQAAAEVDALMGPHGSVVALTGSNILSITDIAGNLRRIQQLLKDSMAKSAGALVFRQFILKHITADDAETLVRSQFGLTQAVRNVSAQYDRSRSGSQPRPAPSTTTTTANVQVTADPRTNSLLVSATNAQLTLVEQILEAIDIDESELGRPLASAGSNIPVLRVYKVKSADATEVTKTIDAIRPGVVVNEDGRNGKIHIMATPKEHEEIAELIQQLDGQGGGLQEMAVVQLSSFDPLSVQATLQSLFLKDGDLAPTIQADLMGRRLLIRGTHDQVVQVRALLAQLGEDGSGRPAEVQRQTGPVRHIPLAGRDPSEFMRMIQQMWRANGSNPIRIYVPGEQSPIEDQRIPAADNRDDDSYDRRRSQTPDFNSDERRTDSWRPMPVRTTAFPADNDDEAVFAELIDVVAQADDATVEKPAAESTTEQPSSESAHDDGGRDDLLDQLDSLLDRLPPADDADSGDTAAPPTEERTTPPGAQPRMPAVQSQPGNTVRPGAPIVITYNGDTLIVSSEDERALDRIEDMIDSLGQNMPLRTTWTIFYLQSADVAEAVGMLEEIFPTSSVATPSSPGSGGALDSITSGISSFGSSLADMTGLSTLGTGPQTLRMIPETRSNALFVTGPAHLVAEVEQMLKVIDASELPQSLRDLVARTIDVQYADIEEVEDIVNEVYKPYIDPPQQQQQGRGNPIAAMMGGGNSNAPAQQIRMTVSADTNTSQLIVACSESLFRQVEALVETLDESAYKAKKSIRIVSLENADAVLVQQHLSSLIPKVKVSTSGGSRRPTTSSSSSSSSRPGQSGQPGQPSPDQMRSFFEQRMRERFGGGAPGGSRGGPGGGGPGGGRFGGGGPGGGGRFGGGRPGGGR